MAGWGTEVSSRDKDCEGVLVKDPPTVQGIEKLSRDPVSKGAN